MDRIIAEVEHDPYYRKGVEAAHPDPEPTIADAICCALRRAAGILPVSATVACTLSGSTALRAARERPAAPILALTPEARHGAAAGARPGRPPAAGARGRGRPRHGRPSLRRGPRAGVRPAGEHRGDRGRHAVRRARHDQPAADRAAPARVLDVTGGEAVAQPSGAGREMILLRAMFDAAVEAALPAAIVPRHLPPPPEGRTIVLGRRQGLGRDGEGGRGPLAAARSRAWSSPATATPSLAAASRSSRPPTRCPTPPAATPPAASSSWRSPPGADDLVLCLISGGGSALLALPAAGPDARGQAGGQQGAARQRAPTSAR